MMTRNLIGVADAAAKAMKAGDYVKSSQGFTSGMRALGNRSYGQTRYGQIKKVADYSDGFGDVVWSNGERDHLNFVNLEPSTQQEFERAGTPASFWSKSTWDGGPARWKVGVGVGGAGLVGGLLWWLWPKKR